MSNNADYKPAAPELDSETAGQDLQLAFCKGGDETNYTFVGSAEECGCAWAASEPPIPISFSASFIKSRMWDPKGGFRTSAELNLFLAS